VAPLIHKSADKGVDIKMASKVPILLGLLLLSSASTMHASAEPFRLGVLQGLTGVAKEDGNTALQAAQLAVDEINAQSPNSIELKVEDDRSTASQTLISYHWLKKNGVDAIIGPTWSSTTNALAPVAAQDRLVLLNTSTLPEALNFTRALGYLFSNAQSLEGELEPFERIVKTRRPKTLIVVHNTGPWGVMLADRIQNIARRYGTAIVQTHQAANADENQDLRDAVPALKIHQADMVALALGPADTELFLRKAAEIGWKPFFFGSKNTWPALRETKFKGLYNGVCYTYPHQLDQNFSKRYYQRYGSEPKIYADNSYDAVFHLYQAWLRAGQDSEVLRDTLRNTSHKGVGGEYTYSPSKSFARGSAALFCVDKDGEPREVPAPL